jgi:hypothetical protein
VGRACSRYGRVDTCIGLYIVSGNHNWVRTFVSHQDEAEYNNIRMDLKKIKVVDMDWILLAYDRNQW